MIFRVTIPNFEHFSTGLLRELRDKLTALGVQWDFGRTATGALNLVSERLTKLTLDRITEILMVEQVYYMVEDLGSQYLHVATTAPAGYDYDGTCISLGLETVNEFGKTERHVAIQKERQQYQFGRYSSGLHAYRIIEG